MRSWSYWRGPAELARPPSRVIDGEATPGRGGVSINGMAPDEAGLKGLFGVMPQEAELREYLTVGEYLYYLALVKGLSYCDARKEACRLVKDFVLQK